MTAVNPCVGRRPRLAISPLRCSATTDSTASALAMYFVTKLSRSVRVTGAIVSTALDRAM